MGTCAVLMLAAAVVAGSGPQQPEAAADAKVQKPGPVPPVESGTPLKIDIGKAIAEVVAKMLATPRFEEHVEIHDRYQAALNAYLGAADLSCGPSESGPPPYDEMNRFRGTRTPPSADLLAGAKWLYRKLKGQGERKDRRYYVYSVGLRAAPDRVVYVVRDGPISEDSRSSVPGTTWELVGRFADQGKAAEAVSRLQRGMDTAEGAERSPVLWAASRCSH